MAYDRDPRRWTGFGKAVTAIIFTLIFLCLATIGVAIAYAVSVFAGQVDPDQALAIVAQNSPNVDKYDLNAV